MWTNVCRSCLPQMWPMSALLSLWVSRPPVEKVSQANRIWLDLPGMWHIVFQGQCTQHRCFFVALVSRKTCRFGRLPAVIRDTKWRLNRYFHWFKWFTKTNKITHHGSHTGWMKKKTRLFEREWWKVQTYLISPLNLFTYSNQFHEKYP